MKRSAYIATLDFLGLPIRDISQEDRRELVNKLNQYTDAEGKNISEIVSGSIDAKKNIVQKPVLYRGKESLDFSGIEWSDNGISHKILPTVYLANGCISVAVDDYITGDIDDTSDISLERWNELILASYPRRQKISNSIIDGVKDCFSELDSSEKDRCGPYTCDICAIELLDKNKPIVPECVIPTLKNMEPLTGLNDGLNRTYSEMIIYSRNAEIPVACLNTEIDESRRVITMLTVPYTSDVVVKRIKKDYLSMVN